MSTFNKQQLANERALITGKDDAGENHKVIVSTLDYNQRNQRNKVELAQEAFDSAVEEFYAPILEAAEAANQSVVPTRDPAFFDVISEGSEGVPAQREHVERLPQDTVVLRLIEAGRTDRLIWVGDTIEVLEYVPSDAESDDSSDDSADEGDDVNLGDIQG